MVVCYRENLLLIVCCMLVLKNKIQTVAGHTARKKNNVLVTLTVISVAQLVYWISLWKTWTGAAAARTKPLYMGLLLYQLS